MIPIRVFFQKIGEARFISHLDLNRFMLRAIKRTGLPVWHTEGFNPHVYVTFATPLSLGQTSKYEIMDLRLTQEMELDQVKKAFDRVMPPTLPVLAVAYPVKNPKEIAFARYEIRMKDCVDRYASIAALFDQKEMPVMKTTKKGADKVINLKEEMQEVTLGTDNQDVKICLRLPAGTMKNINPALLVQYVRGKLEEYLPCDIVRTAVLDQELQLFH